MVTLWEGASATSPSVLRGHRWIVQGVAWSPDGQLLASAGYDNSITLWDTDTGLTYLLCGYETSFLTLGLEERRQTIPPQSGHQPYFTFTV
jgi:WD40 repeat protein